MKLGDIIASIRRRKRIDQKDMAKQLGISVSYLSLIENNGRTPSGKVLTKISEILEIPISGLLFEALDPETISEEKREIYYKAKPIVEQMISILLAD